MQRAARELYVWGRNDCGQLGVGNDGVIIVPSTVDVLRGKPVCQASSSLFHSCFVTEDGDVYMAGANDSGQLASKKEENAVTPHRVDALDTYPVISVATGGNFTVAITRSKRRVLAWGGGEFGQLGSGGASVAQAHPKFMKGSVRIARVAAGGAHSLLLSHGGAVFSCGLGLHGALGHGDDQSCETPRLVRPLWPVGMAAVAAGENHSVALSVDGRVYTWGRGKYGALGLGDLASVFEPRQVKGLGTGRVFVRIVAGGDHTVALAREGHVYSWGQGTWGQTGLGMTDNVCQPQQMLGTEGAEIVQVAAGLRHTLLLGRDGALYGCGNSEHGQLGGGCGGAVTVCKPMPRPPAWAPLRCLRLHAGGDQSFALMAPVAPDGALEDGLHACADLAPLRLPDLVSLAQGVGKGDGYPERLAALVDAVHAAFESPGFLVAGFLLPQCNGQGGGGDEDARHGLDVAAIAATYTALLTVYEHDVVAAAEEAECVLLQQMVDLQGSGAAEGTASMHQAQWLRVLLILLLNPMNGDAAGSGGPRLVELLARVVVGLKERPLKVLTRWLAQLPSDVLGGRVLQPLQRHLTTYVEAHGWTERSRHHVLLVGSLLQVLEAANRQAPPAAQIHHSKFYNAAVSHAALPHLQTEYIKWIRARQGGAQQVPPVSLCELPFLMDPECKKVVLQGEASLQQNHEVRHSQMEALELMAQGYFLGQHLATVGFLDITVRRDALVEDTMLQLQVRAADLKKPLRVTFLGQENVKEEGVDEGGVSKEFFQLLVRALFSGDYGMFEYNEETRECYFSPSAMETGAQGMDFRLVGTVLGLAIFNGIILDVHFPQVVYKKLLGGSSDFLDLLDAKPSLAKGLQKLQEYSGPDVEEVFCLSFEVEYTVFDTVKKVELVPNGSNVPVTAANKQEYVDKVVEWHLDKSVKDAFQHFRDGFYSVCSGYALSLFRYQELELLICGLPHLDFNALEKATRYEGGYTAEHPAIRRFWAVLHSMSLDEKKRFLFFVTGCDRAPMGGLGKLAMVIQRGGPHAERLPTAHTCFNTLLLPEYDSEQSLRQRLLMAIRNAEGFGLQ